MSEQDKKSTKDRKQTFKLSDYIRDWLVSIWGKIRWKIKERGIIMRGEGRRSLIENILELILKHRKISLIVFPLLGVFLLVIPYNCIPVTFFSDYLGDDGKIRSGLFFVALALPTSFLLWLFRTNDVSIQINNQQFHESAKLLVASDLDQRAVGLMLLAKIFQARFFKGEIGNLTYKLNVGGIVNKGKVARLAGIDFSEMNFGEANFRGAILSGAKLITTRFPGANLIEANLSGANLFVANLIKAKLNGAGLEGAMLKGAILLGADLTGANLRGSGLEEANLNGADLRGADLREADLTSIKYDENTNFTSARYNHKTIPPNNDRGFFTEEGMIEVNEDE